MKYAVELADGVFCSRNAIGEPGMTKGDNVREDGGKKNSLAAEPGSPEDNSMMPLDFMLSIMRDPSVELSDRKWAASQAAPYCHARLSSERVHDAGTTHEEILDLL